jgi:protein involved in polysaccharide export with SLBB domain
VLLLLCLNVLTSGGAQTTSAFPPASQDAQTEGSAAGSSASIAGSINSNAPQVALPASRIISILEENPEAVIEVKSLSADLLQQKGVALQADSVTDEQLYGQIESNSELRTSITYFLRARGYVSEDDIARASGFGNEPSNSLDNMHLADELSTTLPNDGLGTSGSLGLSANSGLSSTDGNEQRGAGPRSTTGGEPRSAKSVQNSRNITDVPDGLHRPAPYNLRSLRDLYTQVPDSSQDLKRFGSDVFVSRGVTSGPVRSSPLSAAMPLDVPLGPDYVLGPGDELSISIWGGISQVLTRLVDREGRIMLPEAGQIQIAGLTLDRAQGLIDGALQRQFRNAHVAVTLARLRTLRIYVVGDVQRPGAYDVNSLSSPLTALSAAGGPTAVGSLRVMRHYRNNELLGEIDLYDFLLHGVRNQDDRLQGGDTLLVPPVGPQVAVYGAVKRSAIYELRNEKTLAAVLEDAGGMTVAAALGNITINRIVANQRREEISLDAGQSSDRIAANQRRKEVSLAAGPSSDRTIASMALARFDIKDGDRIHVATLLPYDERVVYLQGHVARPGKLAYHDGLHLSDVIRSYQDLLPEPAVRGEIVRLVAPDLHPETFNFDVPDALIGNSDVTLQPFDTIRVFGRYEQDAPSVSVQGEVLRPGSYPLFDGMTAAQLVRVAGGFKRDALVDDADLVSYAGDHSTGVTVQRRDIKIGDAVLTQNREADARLKPGDILTIHQLTGWNDIGASITIQGEVAHPGSYGFTEGEHLSDVLKRAGGFRATAYPEGAVLTRPEVAALEEKSRDELIRQIETSSAAARLSPGVGGGDQSGTLQQIQQQQQQVLSRLKSQPASGRLVIHVNSSIESWAGTAADIEVRRGDVLRIPKRPGFVLISGQVYNASAITFVPQKTAKWYLERAGGTTEIANRKEIFVVRANGAVVGRRSGSFVDGDVLSTKLDPGDVIVVPQKIIGKSLIWRNLLGTAQIASSIAIAASVAGL